MKNASSLIKRAALSACLLSALAGSAAQAQYFGQSAADQWRSSIGLPPLMVSKQKAAQSKDRFDSMKQTSAVRMGCGIANDEAIANISANFAEIVGIAWGSILALCAFAIAFKDRPRAMRQLARGGALAAAGLCAPGALNWGMAAARDANIASGLDAGFLGFTLLPICLIATTAIITSPHKKNTLKGMALSSLILISIPLVAFVAYPWATNSFQSWQRSQEAARVVAPNSHVPRPAAPVLPWLH